MTPSLDPTSPPADADGGQEFAGPSSNAGILMHTDTTSSTTGWLQDAWRLWARTTERHDTSR
ncbi:MAG TPA: hypothetical protein H9903_19410 [Candidatus Aquabacterium excrementipullorum]|nr:hypothetical protein [Candidatus Aquabacterium excrementipullorum]